MAKCMDCGKPLDLPGQKKGRCKACATKALAQMLTDPEFQVYNAEHRDEEDDIEDALILDGARKPEVRDYASVEGLKILAQIVDEFAPLGRAK